MRINRRRVSIKAVLFHGIRSNTVAAFAIERHVPNLYYTRVVESRSIVSSVICYSVQNFDNIIFYLLRDCNYYKITHRCSRSVGSFLTRVK